MRDLLYKDVHRLSLGITNIGKFTLLRTHKQTITPRNFARCIYTILRVGLGKIGYKEVTPAEFI